MNTDALIIIDHGSRLPESGQVLARVAQRIRATRRFRCVAEAHMDLEAPTMKEALKTCLDAGAERIAVVPFMLGPGRHSTQDIPAQAREAFPDLADGRIVVSEPLGEHRGVMQAVLDRAAQALGQAGEAPAASLLCAERSTLLVIDIQSGLLPHITGGEAVVSASEFLIRAAHKLDVPIVASEQYPKGLGTTCEPIAKALGEGAPIFEKICFGAFGAEEFARAISPDRPQVLLCGIEAHICVMQTAMQAIERGLQVFVAADAVGSRHLADREAALRRMERAGAAVVTAEMAVYEWLRQAGTSQFKSILPLLKRKG